MLGRRQSARPSSRSPWQWRSPACQSTSTPLSRAVHSRPVETARTMPSPTFAYSSGGFEREASSSAPAATVASARTPIAKPRVVALDGVSVNPLRSGANDSCPCPYQPAARLALGALSGLPTHRNPFVDGRSGRALRTGAPRRAPASTLGHETPAQSTRIPGTRRDCKHEGKPPCASLHSGRRSRSPCPTGSISLP